MKLSMTLVALLAVAVSAGAFDLGAQRPDKPSIDHPTNVLDPDRQGGDTVVDATVVTLPLVGETGTTAGYVDDYDEACPYTQSTSADVVYTFTPSADTLVDIDMLGSTYDTKIYVYDQNLSLVACNDDFYSDYVSKLEAVALAAGTQYFLVIDGYGGDFGDYVLSITDYDPCVVDCPAGAVLEGEPPLVDGYADAFNGGCNSPEFGNPIQPLYASYFCGKSGWYLSSDGTQSRDTDWYEIVVPATGYVEIIGDAEFATYMFELGPQDCETVAVIQNVVIGPCQEGIITIPGPPGSTVWFWVGPTTFDGTGEYDYILWLWLIIDPVEAHSWSEVKSLFE
ncbi:MAG: PPC domain-containing protein [Candidatus Krumholzibacteriia bacterium]